MTTSSPTDVDGKKVGLRGRPDRALPPVVVVAIAWTLGLAAVVATRFRSEWETYKSLHRWLSDQGVPSVIRNFDTLIVFASAALIGAGLVAWWRGGSPFTRLGLRRGHAGWGRMVLVSLIPMVAGGVVLGMVRWTPESSLVELGTVCVKAVIRAPLAEELLFRGLLVGVCAAAVGWRGVWFWVNASGAAALFAAMHVTWTVDAISASWATLLMTGAGGLWYAWLLSRWGTLWLPVVMHAGMNLGWHLAGADGGAGGGGLTENLLRAATIAIATWWTVRQTRTCP